MSEREGRMDELGGPTGGPWSNGLLASSYVALTDIAPAVAPRILTALSRARIAAYLASSDHDGALRLHVAASERSDARTIVASVLRASGGGQPVRSTDDAGSEGAADTGPDGDPNATPDAGPDADVPPDPLAGIDADAAFQALIADWHVDTHTAIREAERQLTRDDEDWRLRLNQREKEQEARDSGDDLTWLDEEHWVPPNPPPIPRPTAPFVLGGLLIAVAILLLIFGDQLGMAFAVRLMLAVAAILGATAVFILRLRAQHDEDDDGAML